MLPIAHPEGIELPAGLSPDFYLEGAWTFGGRLPIAGIFDIKLIHDYASVAPLSPYRADLDVLCIA